MSDITATVQLANFPANYCWQGPQTYAEDLVQRLLVTVPGSAGIFVGPNAPVDTTQLWARTVGGYLEGIYLFLGGWYRAHPIPPSSSFRTIYVGTNDAAGLWSEDGGDGTNPAGATATTGSFWAVDTNFNFKIPMGVGTGISYDGGAPRNLTLGATLGEERHTLLDTELPPHRHPLLGGTIGAAGGAAQFQFAGGSTTLDYNTDYTSGNGLSHENLPPVRGVYIIKRTVRQYYVAT